VVANVGNRRRVASSNYPPFPRTKKKVDRLAEKFKKNRKSDAQRTLVSRFVGGRGGRPRAKRSAFVSAATDTLAARAVVAMATKVESFIFSFLFLVDRGSVMREGGGTKEGIPRWVE